MALTYKVQFGQECHYLLKVRYMPLTKKEKRLLNANTQMKISKALFLFSQAGLVN